jgi:exonuclease III
LEETGSLHIIKEAIYQEEISIINLYMSNVGAHNIIKYTLMDLKSQLVPNTVVYIINRSSNKKLNEKILELNDTIDLMDLTDVHRVFHPATAQYTFFSAAHGTFTKIDHILEHKASLNKYKKIKITP